MTLEFPDGFNIQPTTGGGGTTINNQDKTITSNGEYTADTGYTGLGTVTVDVEPTITSLSITPSTSSQTITAPSGTDGYSPISVSAVTSSIDNNITASNIKKNVTILGVTGNYEPTLTTKNITQNGTYNASSDSADGYSSVTVNVSGSGGVDIPREISAGGYYQMPSSNFTFSLPSNATDVKDYVLRNAFQNCTSLTSVDLSSLTTISGNSPLYSAFQGCTSLTSINLSSLTTIPGNNGMCYTFQSCTSLTSVDLSSLTSVSGGTGMGTTFQGCTSLTSVDLSSLTTISGNKAMLSAFQGCVLLRTLSFPALKSNSFGSYTNQFYNMLMGVTGCTVHFPSNLQSVIGSWSDVTSGFGGTNTTVLFDLPATT